MLINWTLLFIDDADVAICVLWDFFAYILMVYI